MAVSLGERREGTTDGMGWSLRVSAGSGIGLVSLEIRRSLKVGRCGSVVALLPFFLILDKSWVIFVLLQ